MTKDETLKLALEALEEPKEHIAKHRRLEAITAIREALAQPEQEPVANDWSVFNSGAKVWSGLSLADAVIELTPDRLERGWCAVCVIDKDNPPLYTTPQPQREWVGLTDEEVSEVLGSDIHDEPSGELDFIRAIEAKLKEKNT